LLPSLPQILIRSFISSLFPPTPTLSRACPRNKHAILPSFLSDAMSGSPFCYSCKQAYTCSHTTHIDSHQTSNATSIICSRQCHTPFLTAHEIQTHRTNTCHSCARYKTMKSEFVGRKTREWLARGSWKGWRRRRRSCCIGSKLRRSCSVVHIVSLKLHSRSNYDSHIQVHIQAYTPSMTTHRRTNTLIHIATLMCTQLKDVARVSVCPCTRGHLDTAVQCTPTTDSTENARPPKSTKSRNSNFSVRIQIKPITQFDFVLRDTEEGAIRRCSIFRKNSHTHIRTVTVIRVRTPLHQGTFQLCHNWVTVCVFDLSTGE